MELIYSIFEGPILPATCFLGLMVAWSLLALVGTVDLDMPGGDIDLDVDVDVDIDSPGGMAADGLSVLVLRWLNLKHVPLVIWLGVFSVTWWAVSAICWLMIESRFIEEPGWFISAALVAKNLLIAIPLTKFMTSPMTKWFVTEQLGAAALVGQEAEISSLEATTDFGQVKYKTEGSPLLLNVRTDGPHLVRGTRVWITHYDARTRTYVVTPTGTEPERGDMSSGEES